MPKGGLRHTHHSSSRTTHVRAGAVVMTSALAGEPPDRGDAAVDVRWLALGEGEHVREREDPGNRTHHIANERFESLKEDSEQQFEEGRQDNLQAALARDLADSVHRA
jgi:hypothetical protein